MKAINYAFHSSSQEELDRVFSEYEFLGRNVRRFRDKVVVYAYPRKRGGAKPRREPAKDTAPAAKSTEQRSKRERWYE